MDEQQLAQRQRHSQAVDTKDSQLCLSERELSWGVPTLSLPSAGGGLRGALRLQQVMCGASDTRERAHDARQRFLARILSVKPASLANAVYYLSIYHRTLNI